MITKKELKQLARGGSKTFKEKLALLVEKKRLENHKHKLKMDELAYSRENSRLVHEQILERGRIKYAEMRKLKNH